MANAWTKAKRDRAKDWLGEWKKLAEASDGIMEGDYRLEPLLELLYRANDATGAKDWEAFSRCAEEALKICALDSVRTVEGEQLTIGGGKE